MEVNRANCSIAATPRQIIYQTQLALISDTPYQSLDYALRTVESIGGYVQASEIEGEAPSPQSASATLRVPVDQRQSVLMALKDSAQAVSRETHSAEEVGDQLVDLEARLKQHRAAESQLLLILATAQEQANSTEHVLSVFHELNRIREQIERLDAQRLALESRVAFATIHLQIRSPKATIKHDPEPWTPRTDATRALATLKTIGQSLTTVLIYIGIVGIPLGVVLVGPMWMITRFTKRAAPIKASA